MAEITRILAANVPGQIFLCYYNYSEYSLLGSKFSTNLLFPASKCTSQYNGSGRLRCPKWPNDRMVAVVKHCWPHCTRKKRLQRKMTTDY